MFRKSTLIFFVFFLVLASTNLLTFKLTCHSYEAELGRYLSSIVPDQNESQSKSFGFSKKDGQIHAGVVIQDSLLSNESKKDSDMAKTFLSRKEWLYVTEQKLVYKDVKYTVFVFRALAPDEKFAGE